MKVMTKEEENAYNKGKEARFNQDDYAIPIEIKSPELMRAWLRGWNFQDMIMEED